uniref:VOC domain-containing protein n=1 Tax=Aegilops tauschii subsp. strangulata TaxID=200361 RepID=A0A453QW57_AEGTS
TSPSPCRSSTAAGSRSGAPPPPNPSSRQAQPPGAPRRRTAPHRPGPWPPPPRSPPPWWPRTPTRASAQESMRHHLAVSVADYDRFATKLKTPGTDLFAKTQPDGRVRQVFFLDRDGNQIFNGGRCPRLSWLLLHVCISNILQLCHQ